MIIINSIVMSLGWKHKFYPYDIYGESFYLDNGEEMKAAMMFLNKMKEEDILYYIDDDVTVLTMDTEENDSSPFEYMVIMLNQNLSNYVENISIEQINQIDKKLKLSSDEQDGV